MTQEASLTTIAICQILFAVLFFAAVIALIYALTALKRMINQKLDEAMNRVQPVVDRAHSVVEQAQSVAEQANRTVETVSAKIDSIAARAETTADRVGSSVESVTARVEEAMNPQVVAAAGIAGSAAKCLQLYRDILRLRQAVTSPDSPSVEAGGESASARQDTSG